MYAPAALQARQYTVYPPLITPPSPLPALPLSPLHLAHGENNPFISRPIRTSQNSYYPTAPSQVLRPPEEDHTTRLPLSLDTEDEQRERSIANQECLTTILGELSTRLSSQNTPQNTPAPSRAKPHAPDVFDGSDPSKMETFILQCSMYCALRSADFPDESAKVSFMLSYLKGSPLDWFQTELSQSMAGYSPPPLWFTSVALFTNELTTLFGPRDPVTDATIAIENLRYRDSGKAVKYSLDFNRHARKTGWNDTALLRQYYKGLPDRLKDEIARLGKPPTLVEMQNLVQTLDQRYWE